MSISDRYKIKNELENTHYDVIIVGGGISGAWVAFQLSSMGLSVALLERGDFASETSSASSKLLHGGIRYLQQLQFGKVRESTLERAEYLSAAPHLAEAVPFLVPTYSDLKRGKFVLGCGMLAYKMLGIGQGNTLKNVGLLLPKTVMYDEKELRSLCDIATTGLTGAVSFPEYHLYDSERTVWSIISSARDRGAVALNYTNVENLIVEKNRVIGVNAKMKSDDSPISVYASLVINAAGPWVDNVIQSITRDAKIGEKNTSLISGNGFNGASSRMIQGYAVGTHLITRQLLSDHAIAITTKQKSGATIDRGGRHIFIIPWRGCSLIGTSYRETLDADESSELTQEDLNQLLDAVNGAIKSVQLSATDVISAYSGLYPLRVERIDTNRYQGSGEYLVVDHEISNQIEGLITALGAKFTTGRILASKAAELCLEKLQQVNKVSSKHAPRSKKIVITKRLSNAGYSSYSQFLSSQQDKLSGRFSIEQINHLVRCYGSDIDHFVELIDRDYYESSESLSSNIMKSQPDIWGQIVWAVDKEMAITIDDVLLRRTSLGLLGIEEENIHRVADIMARRLNWDETKRRSELKRSIEQQRNIRKSIDGYFNA